MEGGTTSVHFRSIPDRLIRHQQDYSAFRSIYPQDEALANEPGNSLGWERNYREDLFPN